MLSYSEKCGKDAVLNTIVMAGAHDAGITQGGGNARTQKLNIRGQAMAGVRLFDLRIAAGRAHGRAADGTKNAELRTYHADGAAKVQETKTRYVTDIGQNVQIEQSKIRAGTFGETLADILEQAKAFVTYKNTEFLILKFDKCLNWPQVAEACILLLGNKLYKGGGNLNLKTLDELAGWVIVVFTEEGQLATNRTPADGINGINNCNGGRPYAHAYDGLQYFGKGGTSLMGLSPINENRDRQKGLMRAGIQCDPDAMGMMYWTSTGLVGNIKKRDKQMWTRTNNASLQKTWREGLGESIEDRLNRSVHLPSGGNVMKSFMPNIIMIDFASEHRCRTIIDLNDVAGHDLMKLVNGDAEAESTSEG
jgi:hypothetical protein